jgi:hypothetical protein
MDKGDYMTKEYSDYLAHHGIKGQKWGVRRFQNEDGSLKNPKGRGSSPGQKKESNSDPGQRKADVKKILGIVGGVAAAAAIGYLAYKGSTNLRDSARMLMEQTTRKSLNDVYTHQHAWDRTYKQMYDNSVDKFIEAKKQGITRTSALREKLGMKSKSPKNSSDIKNAEKKVREWAGNAEQRRHRDERFETEMANMARASLKKGPLTTNAKDERELIKRIDNLESLGNKYVDGRIRGSYYTTTVKSIIKRREKLARAYKGK